MRCSVDGLSLPMFVLAVLGNTMYALGIFLYSVDGVFLLKALPWIIGSVGTLLFDLTVSFLQWCMGSGSFISLCRLSIGNSWGESGNEARHVDAFTS